MFRTACILISLLSLARAQPSPAQVSVGPITGGILVETGLQGYHLESSTSGQFTVTIGAGTANTTIQVLTPTLVYGTSADPGGTSRTATANVNGTTITSGGVNDSTLLPVGSTSISVDLQVDRPFIFPAGIYQYAVEVLITPN